MNEFEEHLYYIFKQREKEVANETKTEIIERNAQS